jgi:hypothetical protein
MTRLSQRFLGPALLGAASFVAGIPGCGPEPVAVDDCRAIEYARCDAAFACGFVEEAESCRRFYRDHCLHGLAAESSPGGQDVEDCVSAIELAGECALTDDELTVTECLDGDSGIVVVDPDVESVCDLVRYPEGIRECEFLNPDLGAAGAGGADDD